MLGVIATSSAVRTQKATHVIKKQQQQQQQNETFLGVRDIFKERRVKGTLTTSLTIYGFRIVCWDPTIILY